MDDVTPPGELVDFKPLDMAPVAVGNTGDAVGNLQAGRTPGESKNREITRDPENAL
jgi:hypothetical protein